MQRINSSWVAVIVTAALIVIPVSIQAAPANSDTEATTSVWTAVQSWTQSVWDFFEVTFDLEPTDELTDDGLNQTNAEPPPEESDAHMGMDPDG